MWLSGLCVILQTKKLPICFQVRAHSWVVGQVPSWGRTRGNSSVFLSHINFSLPLFLPPFPSVKINKYKIFFKNWKYKYKSGKPDPSGIYKWWAENWKGIDTSILTYTPETPDSSGTPWDCPQRQGWRGGERHLQELLWLRILQRMGEVSCFMPCFRTNCEFKRNFSITIYILCPQIKAPIDNEASQYMLLMSTF